MSASGQPKDWGALTDLRDFYGVAFTNSSHLRTYSQQLTATHAHMHTHTHIYTPAKPILYSLEFRAMLRELFNDLHALLLLNFCSKSPKRNLI